MSVIAATHTVVKTSPATHRFGAGILRSVPFAGVKPYTVQDVQDAAAMFADSPEPDYESMALEAAWTDQFNGSFPESGHCLNCSTPCDDLTTNGLCDRCEDAAMDASTASRNYAAGLGFNVF